VPEHLDSVYQHLKLAIEALLDEQTAGEQ